MSDEKQKDRHKLGICIKCEREITICARKMCGRCYNAARLAEDPEKMAAKAEKAKAWVEKNRDKKAATQKAYRERNKDRISPPRKPTLKPTAEFMPDVFCSVCDRSMNRFDYNLDCDGLQAHGVCVLVK